MPGHFPHNPRMPKPRPSLKALFLTGLLTLLPIWLTWIVLKFVFVLLSDLSQPLIGPLLADLSSTNPPAFGWLAQPWVQMAIALVATLGVILHLRRRLFRR